MTGRADRPRVAVSACLLGHRVRYDGRDKRAPTLIDALRGHVAVEPICPEVDAGLGAPREPIELVRTTAGVRVVGVRSRIDRTDAIEGVARALGVSAFAGLVLKRGSPSCEPRAVRVRGGAPEPGRFAAIVRAAAPDLPVVDEVDLADPDRLETFLAAVRVRARRSR